MTEKQAGEERAGTFGLYFEVALLHRRKLPHSGDPISKANNTQGRGGKKMAQQLWASPAFAEGKP